jgi:hypothetical protein
MSEDRALRARWDQEMLDIHAQAKAIGYSATRFHQMLVASGGLAAAKGLINSDTPSDGFTKLWELRRLDLAVESRALQPVYAALFTKAELDRCRKRLRDYGWTAP